MKPHTVLLHFLSNACIICRMNYFIDFEATQHSGEIISVGCVDENGRQFYTCVRPHRRGELTGFITELTGITKADLEAAPTADKAFEDFYDWLDHSEPAHFFCYGNCDKIFIRSTLNYINSFTAQSALSVIAAGLTDFTGEVKRHFGLKREIALIKVIEYYHGEPTVQRHNSLEDAIWLKEIYERNGDEVAECPFPEYARDNNQNQQSFKPKVFAERDGERIPFRSFAKAAEWVITTLMPPDIEMTARLKSAVCNRIILAIQRGRKYYGVVWKRK